MAAKEKAQGSWGRRLLMAAWLLLIVTLGVAALLAYILPPLGPLPPERVAASDTARPSHNIGAVDSQHLPVPVSPDSQSGAAPADLSTSELSDQLSGTPSSEPSGDAAPDAPPPDSVEAEADTGMIPEVPPTAPPLIEQTIRSAAPTVPATPTAEAQASPKGDATPTAVLPAAPAAPPSPTTPSITPPITPPPAPQAAKPEVDLRPLWQRYAQPFRPQPGKPKIAIVVYSLGLSNNATEEAIRQLPNAVTLSFSPYARKLQAWVSLARARAHEAMIDLPLEPVNYPASDPGYFALLTGNSTDENLQRLAQVVDSSSAIVGLTAFMGSRFSTSEPAMAPIVKTLADRGLLYLDNGQVANTVAKDLAPGYGLAFLTTDRILDGSSADRLTIDARLAQLERLALTRGKAIGLARPFPVTIERLRVWSKTLESRGIQLVPITRMVPLFQAPAQNDGDPKPDNAATQSAGDLG
jgi:hypothetical protein